MYDGWLQIDYIFIFHNSIALSRLEMACNKMVVVAMHLYSTVNRSIRINLNAPALTGIVIIVVQFRAPLNRLIWIHLNMCVLK